MSSKVPNMQITISPRESRTRLKKAREAAGKVPGELAEFLEGSTAWHYDLEHHDSELQENISIAQLRAICFFLGIRPTSLFSDQIRDAKSTTPEEFCLKIKEHLNKTGMSVLEFEDRIGFEIKSCLDNPPEVLTWSLDFLRDVCAEIGVDWLRVLE